MERLDPKLDLVFKTLFVRNEALLRNMLEEVLAQPIASFTVCNPGIPGELSTDKEIVLDVRVLLKNQTRVDVEMQIRVRPGLTARLVYYAARDYADQLRRGEAYTMLTPTVIVLWLLEPLFDDLPLHSVFEFRERTHGLLLSDQLQIHLLQLSKLAAELESPREPGITRWARFLVAQDEDELDRLAKETPIMALAKEALEELSQDPEARRLARERSDALKLYQIELNMTLAQGIEQGFEKGIEKGIEQGIEKGIEKGIEQGIAQGIAQGIEQGIAQGVEQGVEKGQRALLRKMLARKFGPLTPEQDARIQRATLDDIDRYVEHVFEARTVSEVLGG